MHCELVVPALFAAPAIPRLPSLELLLARGRAAQRDPLSLEAWLGEEFGLEDGMPPAGAITLLAAGPRDDSRTASWVRADPVHLRLGGDRFTLIPGAACSISLEEADSFVAALNRDFEGRCLFVVVRPDQWCMRTNGDTALEAASPLELAAQEGGAGLPGGTDSPHWLALLNEIQMALHAHPLNAEREERGAPAINSVWFWGAGRLPQDAEGSWNSLTTDDALAAGFAQLTGLRQRALPASGAEWLERAPLEGRHLIVLDALRAVLALSGAEQHADRLAMLEARWFAPLLEALRSGRVGMVSVHACDSGWSSETVRSDLRRFWRRARPLAAYA
jgi:hypothetical protein